MTTQYQCNKCHRFVSVPHNKTGFDTFNRCIITDKCTGSLYFVKRNDNILRDIPTDRSKYKDWVAHPQLFNFKQPVPSSIWRITHTLNSRNLLFYVYTDSDGTLLLTHGDDYVVNIVDNGYLEITFQHDVTGEVQCESHNTVITAQVLPEQYIKVSNTRLLTIATHSHDDIKYLPAITINGIVRSDENNNGYLLGTNVNNTVWGDSNSIFLYGNNYNISTVNLTSYDLDQRSDDVYSIDRTPDNRLAFILLSSGNNYYDKVYDKIIDFNDLRLSNNYVKQNELWCKESIIKRCYPAIIQN